MERQFRELNFFAALPRACYHGYAMVIRVGPVIQS